MAASTRIAYGPTSLGGQHLAAAARYAILAKQEIARALNMANSITVGGVTAANLEASTDFGTVPSGTGAALYTAINNLNTNIGEANLPAASLANLDQG